MELCPCPQILDKDESDIATDAIEFLPQLIGQLGQL
jgi:hypothetical protein